MTVLLVIYPYYIVAFMLLLHSSTPGHLSILYCCFHVIVTWQYSWSFIHIILLLSCYCYIAVLLVIYPYYIVAFMLLLHDITPGHLSILYCCFHAIVTWQYSWSFIHIILLLSCYCYMTVLLVIYPYYIVVYMLLLHGSTLGHLSILYCWFHVIVTWQCTWSFIHIILLLSCYCYMTVLLVIYPYYIVAFMLLLHDSTPGHLSILYCCFHVIVT